MANECNCQMLFLIICCARAQLPSVCLVLFAYECDCGVFLFGDMGAFLRMSVIAVFVCSVTSSF